MGCGVRNEERPLASGRTTEEGEELPEAFAVNGKGLPLKLFTLRQKLYRKAKREPKVRFHALHDRIYQARRA